MNDRRSIPTGSVDLLLTSPPYLKVVNYGTANWIRLWWLGTDEVGRQRGSGRLTLDGRLDHQHSYESYKTFMLKVFSATRRVLRKDGVATFVIGDVAEPDKPTFKLATELWNDIGDESGLQLVDVIEDQLQPQSKVSRIWGETKGQATDCDRILILGRQDGQPRSPEIDEMSWDEDYRDGGDDEAHERLRRTRVASVTI
jgi:site-specific DNA-methyltransferase (adenine-specific)